MRTILRALVWLCLAWPAGLPAQTVPSPADVLGYELGERFTSSEGVQRYAERLASASPRVRLDRYGETPEGRPLLLLIVGREDRLSELDRLLERNAALSDPGLSEARREELARQNPAFVWLGYGVHGDESSSSEAALWTAYDLAADAPAAAGLLDSLVVAIDPMLNPDGRDRYVHWYRTARGARPNPNPATLEHRPPWPRGRFNHYLFDLNRDWAWATQPETRQRLRAWLRWRPQVSVDFHEMSPNSTYFFFPASPPVNPIYPQYTLRWAELFGAQIARAFDERRWLYYTGENFDLYYPGYGDSWPSLWGAIGMTFEQAGGGSAGLAYEQSDGTVLTLADRASHHRVAGLATLRAAAERKTQLLREYSAFHRVAPATRRDILLVPGRESAAAAELAILLQRQGLTVERATRPVVAEATPHAGFVSRREFPVGTFRVPGDQPGWRLARTLLQAETPWDTASRQFSYDLTAWSLPYAFGVEAHSAPPPPPEAFEPLGEPPADDRAAHGPAPAASPGSAIGYLALPAIEVAGPLYRYLALGGRARAVAEEFRTEGVRWPQGSWFVPADDSAAARLERAGLATHVTPVRSARTASGVDLGSRSALVVRAASIAVLGGDGVSAPGYGEAWYLFERVLGIPFDGIPATALSDSRLREYDVLVLPPASRLSEARRETLDRWVRAGGTLVALGSAAGWAGRDLADVATRGRDTAEVSEVERQQRALRGREQRRVDRWEDAVTGIVLQATLDPDHPLAWGAGLSNADRRLFLLHREDRLFEPVESFETVAHVSATAAVSGVVSGAKREQMAGGAWLVTKDVGAGRVILFADNPLFRAFWRSAFGMFANALLLGPAM